MEKSGKESNKGRFVSLKFKNNTQLITFFKKGKKKENVAKKSGAHVGKNIICKKSFFNNKNAGKRERDKKRFMKSNSEKNEEKKLFLLTTNY